MVDEGPASENLHSLRKSRDKYMFSGIRHIAAEREPCRHLRSAPRAAVTHAGLRRMTGCDPIIRERSLHPRPCGVRWTARLHFDVNGTDLEGRERPRSRLIAAAMASQLFV